MGYHFGKRLLVGDHLIMNSACSLIPLSELDPLPVDTLEPFSVQDVLGVGYVPGVLEQAVKVDLVLAQWYLSITPQSFKYPAQPEPLKLCVQPVLVEVEEVKSLDQVVQVEYSTEQAVGCENQYPVLLVVLGSVTGQFHDPFPMGLRYLPQVGVRIHQPVSVLACSRVLPEGESPGEVYGVTLEFTIVKNHPVGDRYGE